MKRYLVAAAGLVVLIAAGWGVFWWIGRGEIGRGVDQAVARLESEGWTVSWESREIGGFPFGYRMRLADVAAREPESGVSVRLPWIAAETAGDRILLHLPESFAAELPGPGAGEPAGTDAPAASIAGEASEAVAAFLPDGAVELHADRLAWRLQHPEGGTAVLQDVHGLAAVLAPGDASVRLRVEAARIEMQTAAEDADADAAPPLGLEAQSVVMDGTATIGSAAELAEMLYAGAPGQAEARLTTGPVSLHAVDAGGSPGSLDWRAEAVETEAFLESGRMELHSTVRGSAWTVEPEDADAPFRGTLTVGAAEALYAMPMAPTGRPDEMAIRLLLRDIDAEDSLWARIDPEGLLPRDPASVTVDLTGRARVTERIDHRRPGAPPAYEIPELTVRQVSVQALGAALEATGELQFLQPGGRPLGEVEVGLTGVEALVDALGRAGLLTADMVMAAQAIMAVYLTPAAGEDAWTAEVRFTEQGPMVNGLPVR